MNKLIAVVLLVVTLIILVVFALIELFSLKKRVCDAPELYQINPEEFDQLFQEALQSAKARNSLLSVTAGIAIDFQANAGQIPSNAVSQDLKVNFQAPESAPHNSKLPQRTGGDTSFVAGVLLV